jgi:undecaprenyl-diphosphatase
LALIRSRLTAAHDRVPPPRWGLVIGYVVLGAAAVLAAGLLLDRPVIAWTASLPVPVRGFFAWITAYGTSDWILFPAGTLAVLVLLGDWSRVPRAQAAAWWEIGTFAAVLFLVLAASGLTTDVIKPVVGRFRPDYVVPGIFPFAPLSFGGYSHYSFPSGHATTMAAVAVMAWFVPGVMTVPIIVAAGLVAVSRIVIDVHFPSDVVGGIFVGAGVGYVLLRWMSEAGIVFALRRGKRHWRFSVLKRVVRRGGLLPLLAALPVALNPMPQRGQTRIPGPR